MSVEKKYVVERLNSVLEWLYYAINDINWGRNISVFI